MNRTACVIGAGPNGLAAAIVLAQQGWKVTVYEAEPQPGGAARTLELTLPGFLHDFGSAVYPFAVGSPFFSSLPLANHGLEWIHSPCPLAHPFDDGTAITLERDLRDAESALGDDSKAWRRLMQPFVERWSELSAEVLQPVHLFSRHPLLMARLGVVAFTPANRLGRSSFGHERTRALFAGLAAHSFLSLDEPLSAAFAILLGAAAHAEGWPIPRGGAQSLTNALCTHFASLGGDSKTSARVDSLASLPEFDLTLCDITPRQLLQISGGRLTRTYRNQLARYRCGPGVFKVDYALQCPIPWRASECARAATVHIGGSAGEIARSEDAISHGRHSERPFVILTQPSLFDPTRAPAGKHTAWAYCHVPNHCELDMLPIIEAQIERFAPGFRECRLARRVFSPAALEKMDANLSGGDISGGAMDLRQFIFRPTWRHYATSAKDLYLCSSSTPPGGGVHGMCGYNAARLAISRWKT
ncbi:MAG: NAD(P)/FAD-dependent oxidoreductase [Candidatus Acidiferrales bacterium]